MDNNNNNNDKFNVIFNINNTIILKNIVRFIIFKIKI